MVNYFSTWQYKTKEANISIFGEIVKSYLAFDILETKADIEKVCSYFILFILSPSWSNANNYNEKYKLASVLVLS